MALPIIEFMKLENMTNSFMNSGEGYNTFIERIDTWILKNFRRVVKLFTEYDIDGDGELSYEGKALYINRGKVSVVG